MFNKENLISDLKSLENESYRQNLYDDKSPNSIIKSGYTIKGNLTIGIGWNLFAFLLTEEQHETICGWIIDRIYSDLNLPWIESLDEPRSRALMNMAYNLGAPKLLEFHDMLSALQEGRWEDAKAAALDSEWARRLPGRAGRIAEVFATGKDP